LKLNVPLHLVLLLLRSFASCSASILRQCRRFVPCVLRNHLASPRAPVRTRPKAMNSSSTGDRRSPSPNFRMVFKRRVFLWFFFRLRANRDSAFARLPPAPALPHHRAGNHARRAPSARATRAPAREPTPARQEGNFVAVPNEFSPKRRLGHCKPLEADKPRPKPRPAPKTQRGRGEEPASKSVFHAAARPRPPAELGRTARSALSTYDDRRTTAPRPRERPHRARSDRPRPGSRPRPDTVLNDYGQTETARSAGLASAARALGKRHLGPLPQPRLHRPEPRLPRRGPP
jgi:hypothetical protein